MRAGLAFVVSAVLTAMAVPQTAQAYPCPVQIGEECQVPSNFHVVLPAPYCEVASAGILDEHASEGDYTVRGWIKGRCYGTQTQVAVCSGNMRGVVANEIDSDVVPGPAGDYCYLTLRIDGTSLAPGDIVSLVGDVYDPSSTSGLHQTLADCKHIVGRPPTACFGAV